MEILITVGIIGLVFALIITLFLPVMKKMKQDAQWEDELRKNSVTVKGHVLSRHVFRPHGHHTYNLVYQYAYRGVSYQHIVTAQQSDYETYSEGTEIAVVCHPHHPHIAHLLINGYLDGTIAY